MLVRHPTPQSTAEDSSPCLVLASAQGTDAFDLRGAENITPVASRSRPPPSPNIPPRPSPVSSLEELLVSSSIIAPRAPSSRWCRRPYGDPGVNDEIDDTNPSFVPTELHDATRQCLVSWRKPRLAGEPYQRSSQSTTPEDRSLGHSGAASTCYPLLGVVDSRRSRQRLTGAPCTGQCVPSRQHPTAILPRTSRSMPAPSTGTLSIDLAPPTRRQ